MFLYILVGLQYELYRLKGQPSPFELIFSHFLIKLNISCDYNDFGFNSFQKIIFSKKNPI